LGCRLSIVGLGAALVRLPGLRMRVVVSCRLALCARGWKGGGWVEGGEWVLGRLGGGWMAMCLKGRGSR